MFWQFETGFISQIDTLLDKEDVSLEELMEEEDILQECKAQNQKLLNYLIRPQIVDQMVNLMLTEPEADVEEKVRFKYSNLASEMLTSDVGAIYDALVASQELLNKLYQFIDTDKPLNPLLASFYSKLVGKLFSKRFENVFEYLKSKNFIELLLNHIETSAIMDLILKLICNLETVETRIYVIQWLHDTNLIGRLINIFKEECDRPRHINASQLLSDIIKTCREHQSLMQDKAEPDLLLQQIESTSMVSSLLENMFICRSEKVLICGISVLQSLLEYKKHCVGATTVQPVPTSQENSMQSNEFEGMPQMYGGRQDTYGPEQMTPLDAQRLSNAVNQVHAAILMRLNDFHSLLVTPPLKTPIKTTVGVIEIPLGGTRIEVAHLITALLSSNNTQVMDKLAELKTLSVLIDLFFKYPWNNFLHSKVEQSIVCILNYSPPQTQPPSQPGTALSGDAIQPESDIQPANSNLINELLNECHLIERIMDICNVENADVSPGRLRPGFMGHLINIANLIVEKCDHNQLQQQLPKEVIEEWETFVETSLKEINKKNNTPLMNEMPMNAMDSESYHQESSLQQAFIEYQMQQMARNLCTQIGFNMHEFSEVNENIAPQIEDLARFNFNFENQIKDKDKTIEFEKICSERAKDSLENNSSDDEDLWEDRDISVSNIAQQKKPLSLYGIMENNPQSSFGQEGFDSFAAQGTVRMDLDNPWGQAENDNASFSPAPIPMDTSNPWNNSQTERSSEPDSWADFSKFGVSEAHIAQTSSNCNTTTCVTTSVLSSYEGGVASCDIPESTTSEASGASGAALASTSTLPMVESESARSMMETTSTASEEVTNTTDYKAATHSTVSACDSCDSSEASEDQENVVSSSTSDSLQNGPC